MALETDSRRFFQLFALTPYSTKDGQEFMSDRARGLFMKGVAADRGQGSTDHPLDSISNYCFSRIVQQLLALNPTFKDEVYPELIKLDFEQRNLSLAKWLKENHPGCENLEIPTVSKNVKNSTAIIPEHAEKQARQRPTIDSQPISNENGTTTRYLIFCLAILITIVAAWFGLRRFKTK